MKVLILGATGLLGSAVTEKLIQSKEHKLTLFSRHATDKYSESNNIAVINGDATSIDDLSKAIIGQNVIFCAVSGNELPKVAECLVETMTAKKVKRLIFTGAVGIYNEIPEEIDGDDNLDNEPAQIPNRKAADIIEASSLNYTLLRPGYLRNGDENDFVLTLKGEPAKGYITSVSSLVNFILQLISDKRLYSRESVSITKEFIKE